MLTANCLILDLCGRTSRLCYHNAYYVYVALERLRIYIHINFTCKLCVMDPWAIFILKIFKKGIMGPMLILINIKGVFDKLLFIR